MKTIPMILVGLALSLAGGGAAAAAGVTVP